MKNTHNAFFPFMGKMTVKQVREYLQQKQSIIIPLGVIEQHGYHLPLSCDALIAEHLSQRIGLKTDILVAPTVYQSYSGGGLPGTINISPSVMSLLINDILISLVSQGFKNFYIFLSHGGSENMRALDNALKLLLRNNPAFEHVLIALLPVWKFDSKGIGWSKALKEKDWHAGWLETSMVMALEPDLVRMDELELDPEPLLSQQIAHPDNYQQSEKIVDDELVVPRIKQRPEIKVGVMGHPERASRELGLKIVEDIVNTASAKIVEIEKQADGKYKSVPFKPEPLIF